VSLKVAYKKNDDEREQRIELLARQFVKNHLKRMQRRSQEESSPKPIQRTNERFFPAVANSPLHDPLSGGDEA
jgi:hypothetical protein